MTTIADSKKEVILNAEVKVENKIYTYDEAFKKSIEYFNGDELAAKVFVDKYALRDSDNNLLEATPEDMHWRLASEFARIEKGKFKKPMSKVEIFEYLDKFKRIIAQGSPMYGIGNTYQYVSVGNCFVLPSPLDSYLSIMNTDTQITQISCRRGGVGWSTSKLRPKHTYVRNAARTTSGMVEFAKRFSNTIREVGQHGRRGASLQSCSAYHPEILDFIKVKQDLSTLTGSNISVEFPDDFMKAVENSEDIELRWPVCEADAKEMGRKFPEITKKVNAKKIWDEFVHSAWLMAEPGCMFVSRVHEESPGVPYGQIETSSNPCGEQFLPPHASCRLMAINLFGYVINAFKKNARFDFDKFENDVKIMQRLADNLVDLEIECIDRILNKMRQDPEPESIKKIGIDLWESIRSTAILDRRTGCGFTALGDALAALGIRYASDESIEFVEKMQKSFAMSAYSSSVEMAKELGAFPQFDPIKDVQSGFIRRIREANPSLFKDMQKYGRRNMVLLTIAPTGSVSCLSQTSSGLEPVFMLEYTRRKKGNPGDSGFNTDFVDQSGDHWMNFTVYHHGYKLWMDNNSDTNHVVENSPYYKSTANEIDWINRVKLQATLQKWIDNSISSTINLPKDVSESTVSEIYLTAWKSGCKGVTIYREGCRSGVLVDSNKEEKNSKIQKTNAPKRPKTLECDIYHTKSRGDDFFVLVGLYEGYPYEVFAGKNGCVSHAKKGKITKNKRGHYSLHTEDSETIDNICELLTDEQSVITRMISLSLRHGSDISYVVDQLEKSPGDMTNFGKAMARVLKKYIPDGVVATGYTCDSCGSNNLVRQEGCLTCKQCGNSKCS